jgi:probable F420-dependent oxidoreductase
MPMRIDTGLVSAEFESVARAAREAEALGYDGLWTAEAGHDPFLSCAIAASATERLSIGTNIAVAFPRSPLVHAQIAWDLQDASRGRFILGLGTQVKGHNERRYSTKWLPPGPRLREMIQLIHHIWDVWQNGTKPGFEGKFYQFSLMTPFFSPGPIEWPKVPIYIAGVNPYICRLAGELCDGFLAHPFHSIKYIDEVVMPNISAGLAKSGRTRKDIALSTTAFVVTGRTRDEIERNKGPVRQQIAFYASTRTYIGVLEAHGWGETCIRLNEKAAKGDWSGMASLITDEMLDVYAVQGTIDEIPGLIKKKYLGVMDRLGFYALPGVFGDGAARKAIMDACRG